MIVPLPSLLERLTLPSERSINSLTRENLFPAPVLQELCLRAHGL